MKVFIDPGHGGIDSGAVGNGLKEKDLTLSIATKVKDMLLRDYQNVEVQMSRYDDSSLSLVQRTTAANKWFADLFVSIHINSATNKNATGFESFIYSAARKESKSYQQIIHEEIMKQAIGLRDRGKKTADYFVLRFSNMPAILTENGFINNPDDAKLMKTDSWIQKVALGHVEGIAKALNLKKRTNKKVVVETLYRVQVGAFEMKENADRLAEELRAKNFSTYVKKDGNYYKVQVGAYSVKANAEKTAEVLRSFGYKPFITV